MTKQDRRKVGILVVLLGVLGVTITFGYRANQPETVSAVRPPQQKSNAVSPQTATDAQIRMDILDHQNGGGGEVGKRNLFVYHQAPPPPPSLPPRGLPPTNATPSPETAPPQINRPAPPPTPPPITLKYQGFEPNSRNGGIVAFLADEARHYNVTAGEILMGRFRIVSITDKSVEVEDLDYNRRQTLPLQK
jgi:hypothetical protein